MYASQPVFILLWRISFTVKIRGCGPSLPRLCSPWDGLSQIIRNILRKLTDDSVDEIATLAAVDLARLGEPVSEKMLQRISSFLFASRGLHGKTETLFYSLSALGSKQAPFTNPSWSIQVRACVESMGAISCHERRVGYSSYLDSSFKRPGFSGARCSASPRAGAVEAISGKNYSPLSRISTQR